MRGLRDTGFFACSLMMARFCCSIAHDHCVVTPDLSSTISRSEMSDSSSSSCWLPSSEPSSSSPGGPPPGRSRLEPSWCCSGSRRLIPLGGGCRSAGLAALEAPALLMPLPPDPDDAAVGSPGASGAKGSSSAGLGLASAALPSRCPARLASPPSPAGSVAGSPTMASNGLTTAGPARRVSARFAAAFASGSFSFTTLSFWASSGVRPASCCRG